MSQPAIATLEPIDVSADGLPSKIHLLRTGSFPTDKYGKLDITNDDVNQFVDNFNKGYGRPGLAGTGKLPVNFGHDKGGRAAAWINSLEADAEGNLWGNVDWTAAGKSEVEGKNYEYISSEFTPRCLGGAWKSAEGLVNGIKNVFTGAALTNIPMFNGNRGINASAESEARDADGHSQVIYISADERKSSMDLAQLRVKDADKLTAEEKKFVEVHASELSPEEKTKFNIEASSASEGKTVTVEAAATSTGVVSVEASDIKKMLDENKELKGKVEASETAKSELQKTVDAHAEQLTSMRTKEVEASVDAAIASGKIVADQKEVWTKSIMADASMADVLDKIPANKLVDGSAVGDSSNGSGAAEASQEVVNRTNKLMSENKDLSAREATQQVLASDTKLAGEYAAELKAAIN